MMKPDYQEQAELLSASISNNKPSEKSETIANTEKSSQGRFSACTSR